MDKVFEKISNCTILITGATGMIGQNIVRLITQENDSDNTNIKIIAHGRSKEKFCKVFKDYLSRDDFESLICDIKDIQYSNDVDFIIHTAGVTGGSKQHLDFPMTTIATALEGTKKVLDLALDKKCKGLVYLSTLEIYGSSGFSNENKVEDEGYFIDTTNPRSSYPESKRMCECMCASYTKQYGLPTYIARLTATFGYGVAYNDNRVFAQFARSIIEKEDIVLKSTGETVRNYCDAEDASMAFLYLLAFGEPGQAYNVANMDTEISIKDLALKFIESFSDCKTKLVFDISDDATKLGYNQIQRNVLDSSKLMLTGWNPKYSLDDTIIKLVDYMKEYD
jgi:dTDP-glucose 4,6-dehydratase